MRGGERRKDDAQRAKEYKQRCAEGYQAFFGALTEEEAPRPAIVRAFCVRWCELMHQVPGGPRGECRTNRRGSGRRGPVP